MKSALKIDNLKKTYNNGVVALKGIDLDVKKGDFFALLGPNGAGKSTTIGITTSLVRPTSGTVEIMGYNTEKDPTLAKQKLGVVPQEFNFNIFEKVIHIVAGQAGYFGIPRGLAKERAEYYLNKLQLWSHRDKISKELSGGMKRRLMIARALVHDPELLILDEPTAGVDIEIRRSMWDFLQEMNEQGTTIVLTTHYLEEAEQLCKNIAIIDNGKVVKSTSVKSLLSELNHSVYQIEIDGTIPQDLEFGDNISLIKREKETLEICISKKANLNSLFQVLDKNSLKASSIKNKVNRLEQLFLNLVDQESK